MYENVPTKYPVQLSYTNKNPFKRQRNLVKEKYIYKYWKL
jgi:hypothetical protein